MDLGIKGKKVLVTGGASGIGGAIALDLAKEGARVAITSRREVLLEKALKKMGGRKAGHYASTISLTEEDSPQALADQLWKNFGHPDIIVNNIGDTLGITDPYCPISDWRKVFRLNLEVAIELNNLFIPSMKKKGWGRIVNISAGASMENSGPAPYCSAKAALTAYSRCMGRILATEAKDVVMSAVLPGVVLTEGGHWDTVLKERPAHARKYLAERCPLGRFGKPSEISPMVLFLCSKLATFCHGAIVPVDAGQAKHYFNVS
ncbi:MAG: SDR family oxidoreductase [Candidatus Omnitrophica bacterium]|nr:SDR family oxidoreductase [Candidatus Omnitrophota bacterium]